MRSRIHFVLLACLAATIVSTLVVITGTSQSHAGTRVTLASPVIGPSAVVLKGRAPVGAKVRVVRRTTDGWQRVAIDRADRRGRYRLELPRTTRRWVVRSVSGGNHSRRRVIPAATAASIPPADATPKDETPVDETPADETPTEPSPADDACGPRLRKADGSWWECTFTDDFAGDTIDPNKWIAQQSALSGVTNGRACYAPERGGIAVSNGTLRLTGLRHAEEFVCKRPLGGGFATDLTAATITTKGRFNQAYGRFAFRAKMPDLKVQGAHSALWLYPDKHLYGVWPLSGEIDVAEWYSAIPEQVFPSVHYVDGLKNVHSGKDGIVGDASVFHTYELEWTPTRMRFYYDGVLTFQHAWNPLAPLLGTQPFDKPFNVVLTQAWGGLWNAPTSQTPDRFTMTVDWVRVWR